MIKYIEKGSETLKIKSLTGQIFAIVAILGILSFVSIGVSANSASIGYIDLNETYQAHPEMEPIAQEMEEEMGQMQAEMQELMQELQEEGNQQQLQQLQQQYQQQIQQKQAEFEAKLDEAVSSDLDTIREELGLEVILIDQAIISGAEDVTEEVVEYFNQL